MAAKIEDYALIGDLETAALIDRNGSMDWLCWPDFASGACFASLLGTEENGYWKISPANQRWTTSRAYRPQTLILETTFETADGTMKLIDFMHVRARSINHASSHIVRIAQCLRGSMDVHMELALRFDYGRTVPWVSHIKDGVRAIAGPNLAILHASVPTRGEDLKTIADFHLAEGECAWFTLSYGASHLPDPRVFDYASAIKETERLWKRWSGRLQYTGPYQQAVERSLITLKAMTFRRTGGIVAAITTSLPEAIGGVRNWDYRYCWLRDTTFTLLAFTNGGYFEEADRWQDWLLRALAGSPDQVQIMYGLQGERQLVEWEVDWLPGYENSRPVRVGNAASAQVQLDIYGEVLDSFYHANQGGKRNCEADFRVLNQLLEHLEQIWFKPDQGIWETRGDPQNFTHSKMMAWVAFDRAVMLAEQRSFEAPIAKWKALRDRIHSEICANAFNPARNAFTQAYGSDHLDAALLLMPVVGFLPGTDPRVKGTVEAIERELMPNGLVLRYDTTKVNDGLPPGEGVFLACSFWMVSCLKAIGRPEDAHALFERLIALSNDLGLLAEEYDIGRKRQVGNFPQAFSHIALVNAAFDLADGPAVRQRSHRTASKASKARRNPKAPKARKGA
jgi:GH15 family glucan-1,4-alpha-glucosidase